MKIWLVGFIFLFSRIYIPMKESFLVPSKTCGLESKKTAIYEWRNESLLDAQAAGSLILEISNFLE